MSEADNQATSILLPTSSVAVFSQEQSTLQAARDLINDWRFARVDVQAVEGDVEVAIRTYQSMASHDLIVIQTSVIDESFTDKLGELASHCEEGTSAIIIGPDNDVNLYRKLIEMGVSDYMVHPVSAPDLAAVTSKAIIEKIGVSGSNLIAVMGAKGGVGATIIAEALACGVADVWQEKTILLDTSGGWSTLSVGLGFEPATTLSEAARAAMADDEDSLNRMMHRVTDKLSVLATGGDVMLEDNVTAEQLEVLLGMLMSKCPVVIADLSQSPQKLQKAVVSRAQQILIATTPTLPSLRLARTLLQEVKEVRGGQDANVSLVVNMQGQASANEVSKGDIEKAMEIKVDAYLPYDPKVFLGNESEGKRLTDDAAARLVIEETLLPIIQKILGKTNIPSSGQKTGENSGFINNLVGKLKK